MFRDEIDGAWEVNYVIGTRIEIDYPKITILWRNSPVLRTKFKKKKTEDGIELVLKENGLKYEGQNKEYATVTKLLYSEGRLTFVEYFPITGESSEILDRTKRSRYGDCEIVDGVLKELQGKWVNGSEYLNLEFRGDDMILNGERRKVHAVRYNSGPEDRYKIIDQDPSVYDWGYLSFFDYYGGRLTAHTRVCDAPSVTVEFEKAEK